ncbi:hypothetical protein L210DRAFT_3551522 [Boletus edulis BED1]|uniref:Uncharacterized protein n=1 Tax=Boletus edulis BED1 TaxID=1328754 RepID=A0AAD4BNB1_BOLED|nr:hypothetical protein L210DRAFT_3551522 [Boletus edulis BED1]
MDLLCAWDDGHQRQGGVHAWRGQRDGTQGRPGPQSGRGAATERTSLQGSKRNPAFKCINVKRHVTTTCE